MKYLCLTLLISLFFGVMVHDGFCEPPSERARASGVISAPVMTSLPSAEGQLQAIKRQTQAIYTDPTGASSTLPIAAIIVPSKLLCWVALDINPTYFVLKDCVVAAYGDRNDVLILFPSKDRMTSISDEAAVQKYLDTRMQNIVSEHLEYNPVVINLPKYLGLFPFTKEPSSMGSPAPKIENVAVEAEHFSVTLSGGIGDKVKAIITLANDFSVISATLDGKQVYSK